MEKSEFLKEISSMSRDDIRKFLENNPKSKKKLISPVYFVRKYDKGDKK